MFSGLSTTLFSPFGVDGVCGCMVVAQTCVMHKYYVGLIEQKNICL